MIGEKRDSLGTSSNHRGKAQSSSGVPSLDANIDEKSHRVKIYIVTEILARELIGNLLLASVLASRGHIAIILNQEDAFTLSSASVSGTTIFHAKSIHYASERIRQHTKLRGQGFLITSQDQETFASHRNLESRVSERFCEENLKLVERSYVWSDAEADEVCRQFPGHSTKVKVTGSPREDIWGRRFRPLSGDLKADRKRILIVASVGHSNHRSRHWEILASKRKVLGPGASPIVLEGLLESMVDGLRSQLVLSRIALKLADAFPACDVVIQPKKSEIMASWLSTLYAADTQEGTRENLFLETSRILDESIHSADVVINSNSMAGISALVGDVPLISIGPTFSLSSEIGLQLEPGDDIVSAVRQALRDPGGFIDLYQVSSRKKLGKRLRSPSATMATEEIVKDLESFDLGHGGSKLTYRDRLLYLAPGSIRRFFSGIKAIVSLKAPIRPSPEKLTTVSQSQIDDLLGLLFQGLGSSLDVKASVAGWRNIVVRPRRIS